VATNINEQSVKYTVKKPPGLVEGKWVALPDLLQKLFTNDINVYPKNIFAC